MTQKTTPLMRPVKQKLQPLLIAIQFLSTLPVGKPAPPGEQDIGRSLAYYPLVGALLGLLLSGMAYCVMQVFDSGLSAALVLAVWVYLTGALHIDGLADCADAWMGGLGSKKRTLELMEDPTSGPFAIAVLVLVLLLKFTALEAILTMASVQPGVYLVLMWPLIFARMSAMILCATTPYARVSGLGKAISDHLSANVVWGVCCLALIVASLVFSWQLLPVLFVGILVFLYLRHVMLKRIHGWTGDTAGALIELSELAILLVCTALSGTKAIGMV